MRSGPWVAFLIVLVGLATYSNSFYGPFIFDDISAIPKNPTIQNGWQLGTVLSPPNKGETVSGRPILNLSFALNYALGGANVWGYHITNLAIHLLNGLLLLGILRRTFLLPTLRLRFGDNAQILAAAIALLWVVHPLQTEAVTYIAQRAESLAAMFYLLVFYTVIRGVQSPLATVWYVAAVIACWLGIGTKETVVTAPVMVLLYDRTLLTGSFRQALRQRFGLYLGLAASWGLLAGLILQRGFVTKTADFHIPGLWWAYARSQPGVILYYLRQVVWPHPLCLEWGMPAAKTASEIYLPMLVIGLLLVATIWALCRSGHDDRRAWGLLGAWFFLILAPSSSVMPLTQLACEYRMYLPLAAAITLLVVSVYLAGQRWMARGRLAAGLGLVILAAVVLGVLTFWRNEDYRSDVSIWEDAAQKAPCNPLAHNEWGFVLLLKGRPSEAIEHFKKALALDPNHARAHSNWGNALLALGQPMEAIEHFQQAAAIDPNYATVHNNWGNALLALDQPAEAIEHFKKAIAIDPSYADARNYWGQALMSMDRPLEAAEQFQEVLQIRPGNAGAQNNWGVALLKAQQPAEAAAHFEQALRVTPNNALIQSNLGNALLMLGRLSEAIDCYEQALRIMPDHATTLQNLSIALERASRNQEAKDIQMRLQHDRDQKPARSGP